MFSRAAAALAVAGLALAMHISQLAAESEQKIVRATKIALTISASGNPNHPKWDKAKKEMLNLIREGVAINPHYRKITPMVADELARWGDWRNATWIWESVLQLAPLRRGDPDQRGARAIRRWATPTRPWSTWSGPRSCSRERRAVRSLEVILLSRAGQEARALELAPRGHRRQRRRLRPRQRHFRPGLAGGRLRVGRQRPWSLRMAAWPASRAEGHVQLGNMYASGAKDPDKALAPSSRPWRWRRDSERHCADGADTA